VLGYFEKSPVQAYGLLGCVAGGALCGYLLLSSSSAEGSPAVSEESPSDDEPL